MRQGFSEWRQGFTGFDTDTSLIVRPFLLFLTAVYIPMNPSL